MNLGGRVNYNLPPGDGEPEYASWGPVLNYPPPIFDEPRPGEPRYVINMNDDQERRYAVNRKIMVSAIIFLLLVVLFVFLLHVYATWFWRQSARFSRRNRRRSGSMRRRFYFTGEERLGLLNVGLDSGALQILPIFLYKSQNFIDGLDCAVCLCEFEENEKARLLPNCRHSFHVECIDMWFRSHSTCPVCRTGVRPEHPALESVRTEQVSATIPAGSISSGIHDNMNSEQGQSAVSGREEYNVQNPTNIFWWDRQKLMNAEIEQGTSGGRRTLVLPQISIEIPRSPDAFSLPGEGHFLSSPNGSQSSAKSPVTRLRSLTTMLSRDTERKVFLSSVHPGECDLENNGQ